MLNWQKNDTDSTGKRVCAQDQQSRTSTLVSAHRPELAAGDWSLEPGSLDGHFRVRFVSQHYSQPSGWYLDIHSDPETTQPEVVVRKFCSDESVAEWLIELAECRSTLLYRLRSADPKFLGWTLKLGEKRTEDSSYLCVHSEEESLWILEMQLDRMALACKPKTPARFYEASSWTNDSRRDVARHFKEAASGSNM